MGVNKPIQEVEGRMQSWELMHKQVMELLMQECELLKKVDLGALVNAWIIQKRLQLMFAV